MRVSSVQRRWSPTRPIAGQLGSRLKDAAILAFLHNLAGGCLVAGGVAAVGALAPAPDMPDQTPATRAPPGSDAASPPPGGPASGTAGGSPNSATPQLIRPIASLTRGERATVEGRVRSIEIRPAEQNTVLAYEIEDPAGHLTALFYGRSHIAGLYCGSRLRLSGRIGIDNGRPAMINPAYELLAAGEPP